MSSVSKIAEDQDFPEDAWDLLQNKLSESRRRRLQQVAQERTQYVRLVLQDVFDPHNVGACLRSAEAFGLQACDQINLYQKFTKISTVSRGANHWLDIKRFDDLRAYAQSLKAQGYKVAAAYPSPEAMKLEQLPLDRPLAIVFGNEREGLHKAWDEHIDYRFTIPMYGMVESLNISVSVALTLHNVVERCRRLLDPELFHLSALQQKALLNRWICKQSYNFKDELRQLRRLLHEKS